MTEAWGHDRSEAAGTAGPSPGQSSPETGSEPPTWWEVGDALWLAAHRARTNESAPPPPPAEPHAAPGETAAPPSARPPEPELPPPDPEPEPESASRPHSPGHGPAPTPPLPDPWAAPHSSPGVAGAVIADPVGRPVGDRQALTRAVGLFRRYRESGAKRLDEEATAESFAARALAGPRPERGLRTPVIPELAPRYEPADDLVLLIDDSLAMQLQQPVVTALSELLAPLGVFRRVRTCYFDSDKVLADDIELRASTGHALDPHRLCGGNGHEIVLVLTDGIGDGWHTGAVEAWLAYWGRSAAVGVGQVLDRARWPRTGMRSRRVNLDIAEPPGERLAPNAAYRVRPHDSGLSSPDDAPAEDAVAVPLIPMEAPDVGRWARFVSRRQSGAAFPTTALLAEPAPRFPDGWTAGGLPEPLPGDANGEAVPRSPADLVAASGPARLPPRSTWPCAWPRCRSPCRPSGRSRNASPLNPARRT